MHLDDTRLNRCGLHRGVIAVTVTASTRTATPTVATHAATGVTTGFDFFLLGLLISPAGRQLGAFDFFAVFGSCRAGWLGRCRAASGFVQRAFDRFAVDSSRFFRLRRFFRDQHLLSRCVHHGANRFGFCQSGATTGIKVYGLGRIFLGLGLGIGLALGDGFCCCQGSRFRVSIRRSHCGSLLQRFALFVFLDLAKATLFGQLFFLTTNKFSLATGLFFASGQLGLVQNRRSNRGFSLGHFGFSAFAVVALDEGAFFAHFHLNGTGFSGGVSLFDLAGGLLHQGDFFALRRVCAVAGF